MKTNVSESSRDAYHNQVVGKSEPSQETKIEVYVFCHGRCTRTQVARGLGFKESLVGARVNKLIKEGFLQEELSRFPCPVTGSKVHWIFHKDYKAGQEELFQ